MCVFYNGMMQWTGYGYGMMLFFTIFWVLSFVALVLFIFWLVKQIQQPRRR